MYPNFFSEFPDYSSTISNRLENILARNIECYNIHNIDRKVVEYFYRVNRSKRLHPPFDSVKFAKHLDIEVSYDDFGLVSTMYGRLDSPKSLGNPNDFFKISVNNRLCIREKRFTVGHETVERLIGFDKKGEVQHVRLSYIETEAKEMICDKIAREILIPSPSIKREIHRLSGSVISLKSAQKLAGTYEVPLSQMLFKLAHDLNLWDAVLYYQKDEKSYGNKRIFLNNEHQFPVCEFDCYECRKKRSELEEEAISTVLRKIKNNEEVKGMIREDWKEKPLPTIEKSYWIAYRIGSEQITLV